MPITQLLIQIVGFLIKYGPAALGLTCTFVLFAFVFGYVILKGGSWTINYNRDRTNLLSDEPWTRWQYAPGEWQQSNWARSHPNAAQVPTPWVTLGPYGVNHETKGFQTIRNLLRVQYLRAEQTGIPNQSPPDNMGHLQFLLSDTDGNRYSQHNVVVEVSVPKGKEAEAVALKHRFINERLHGQNH